MSTSEAQVMARALYDSLVGGALQSLRAAASRLEQAGGDGAEQRVAGALPADAPRELRNLLLVLANEGKLDQLPNLVRAFERYTQEAGQGAVGVEITSAVELDGPQRERIVEQLRASHGERLELRYKVDPSIIGGLIIRVGDQVLDNSLRTRLSAVQRNMLSS